MIQQQGKTAPPHRYARQGSRGPVWIAATYTLSRPVDPANHSDLPPRRLAVVYSEARRQEAGPRLEVLYRWSLANIRSLSPFDWSSSGDLAKTVLPSTGNRPAVRAAEHGHRGSDRQLTSQAPLNRVQGVPSRRRSADSGWPPHPSCARRLQHAQDRAGSQMAGAPPPFSVPFPADGCFPCQPGGTPARGDHTRPDPERHVPRHSRPGDGDQGTHRVLQRRLEASRLDYDRLPDLRIPQGLLLASFRDRTLAAIALQLRYTRLIPEEGRTRAVKTANRAARRIEALRRTFQVQTAG